MCTNVCWIGVINKHGLSAGMNMHATLYEHVCHPAYVYSRGLPCTCFIVCIKYKCKYMTKHKDCQTPSAVQSAWLPQTAPCILSYVLASSQISCTSAVHVHALAHHLQLYISCARARTGTSLAAVHELCKCTHALHISPWLYTRTLCTGFVAVSFEWQTDHWHFRLQIAQCVMLNASMHDMHANSIQACKFNTST